jgi:hypothetical protein
MGFFLDYSKTAVLYFIPESWSKTEAHFVIYRLKPLPEHSP